MTYTDMLKYYQTKVENLQKRISHTWLNNFDDVAAEVLINAGIDTYRVDIARKLIEDYYNEFYGILANGSGILRQLEVEGYTGQSREEVGWGEHDYFVHLKDKGRKIVENKSFALAI